MNKITFLRIRVYKKPWIHCKSLATTITIFHVTSSVARALCQKPWRNPKPQHQVVDPYQEHLQNMHSFQRLIIQDQY